MTGLTAQDLRDEAKRLRELARKYDEMADLVESNSKRSMRIDSNLVQKPVGRASRGEAFKQVLLAAATFDEQSFTPADVIASLEGRVPDQTVFATFSRDNGRHFDKMKTAGRYEYRMRGFAWVFSYGINMDSRRLAEQFQRKGFDYESLAIGSVKAVLPGTRLSWRNKSQKWNAGTATFDDDEESEVLGVAHLVRIPEGVRAFQELEKPAYHQEHREIIIGGRRVRAMVFNVAPDRRRAQNVLPSSEYLEIMKRGAEEHGIGTEYLHEIEQAA